MVEKLKGLYVKHRLLAIIGIIWTVAVATLVGHSLYTTHKVNLVYDGIMYQAGNKEVEIPIVMKVQGKYYTTLNGKPNRFEGKIIVGDDVFPYTLGLYRNRATLMTSYGSTYGSLHFNNAFNRFTITIFKLSEDARSIGWSNSNGWIISAPAINRKDAVNLSKNLLLNYYGHIEIE